MKISLINPPFNLTDLTGKTSSMRKVMNITQPLGLAYIAAYLLENGYEVKIYDCQCLDIDSEELVSKLKKESPEIIGFTSTTPMIKNTIKTARKLKKELPNTIIIIGGSHVSALPKRTLSFNFFDIGIRGEGEITTLELIKSIEKYGLKKLKHIKGIVYRKGKNIIITSARPLIENLDKLPFPARHLLPPLEKYKPTPASYIKLPQAQVITSRGCPSNCTFCDHSVFGSTYRFRSVKNVFDEIEELINVYGMRDLKFFDDTFTMIPNRVYEICNEFKKRKIDIQWCTLTKVNLVNKKMLKRMKDAGCWQVLFGLESMDEKILASLKKGTTVKQNISAVKWAHEVGLSVRADFLIGTPLENINSIKKTLNEAKKLNMDFAHFNKFTPYPGTELYKVLVSKGYNFKIEDFPSQLDHTDILYNPPQITKEEFIRYLNECYRQYYMRPRYISKQILKMRSFEDFKRMINGFLAVYRLPK